MTMNMSCLNYISDIRGYAFHFGILSYFEASYFQITFSVHKIENKLAKKRGHVVLDQNTDR